MHKLIMCTTLFFGTLNLNLTDGLKVKEITYNVDDYENGCIGLNIDIYSSKKDLIEMKVYFSNDSKQYNDFFSSALSIIGLKSTFAKIPFELQEKTYLKIIFYSNNLKKDFEMIDFWVYPREGQICNLNEQFYCISKVPSVVKFFDGEIKETYDKISLMSTDINYYSFDNKLPLKKIKISSYLEAMDGYANLYISKEISGFFMDYNDRYVIPLLVNYKNNVLSFSLANKYYVDLIKGITCEDYCEDTIYDNQIVFPYLNDEYEMTIEIVDCFYSFEKITLDFNVITSGGFFGKCSDNKYCLRRNYI